MNPLHHIINKSQNFRYNSIYTISIFFINHSHTFSSSTSSLETINNTSKPNSVSNPLYTFLPPTQNPNNLVNIISSYFKKPDFSNKKGLSFLQLNISSIIPNLTVNEISRVLLRCQSDSSSALAFFNWVQTDLCLKPSKENYCLIVHILAWSKNYSLAMKCLSELIQLVKDSKKDDVFDALVVCSQDCNWDPVVFDMLVKAYVKAGMVRQGFRVFKTSNEAGYSPTVTACNFLLNGLLKFKRFEECWEVYEEMGRVGIHPNTCTFNILTHVFCKDRNNIDKVNDFLERMEEEGFDPDIVTYNTLIGSYCRMGKLDSAFYLYKIMYRRNVLPDLVSYTALINALCKAGNVKEAHQLFHNMVHRKLIPDTFSYNTLISGYCKEGRIREARSLLHEMMANGTAPDDFTCKIFVETYGKLGNLVSAVNLLVELKKFGVLVPCHIYEYLIMSLCKDDRPFAAKSLLKRINEESCYIPRLEIMNELIESLCRSNNVDEALLSKKEMMNTNIKPDLGTYKCIVSCLCKISRSTKAKSLIDEMLKIGLQPDTEICRALVQGFIKEQEFDKAESLLVLFAMEFQIFDTESFNTLVSKCSEDGDVSKLMEFQKRMLKFGFAPNLLTCKYVISGLQKATRLEKHKLCEIEV